MGSGDRSGDENMWMDDEREKSWVTGQVTGAGDDNMWMDDKREKSRVMESGERESGTQISWYTVHRAGSFSDHNSAGAHGCCELGCMDA